MSKRPVGYLWLCEHFGLDPDCVRHRSLIGGHSGVETFGAGKVTKTYQQNFWPGERPVDHLQFAIKRERLQLDLLAAILLRMPAEEIASFVNETPNGKYARTIGFLYEFITRTDLPLSGERSAPYHPVLDPMHYVVTHAPVRVPKWRIANNLLGSQDYCPVVCRTPELNSRLDYDIGRRIEAVRQTTDPLLFRRAVDFLYLKETKSSYAIEHEAPPAGRAERFMAALRDAGSNGDPMNEAFLTRLQNLIVDPRFAEKGYRDDQNYIAQSRADNTQLVHYICPPPDQVRSMMRGLEAIAKQIKKIPTLVATAAVSFGFVYVHPFGDGNGRIHRFLIHDLLVRGGVVPQGLILPVSAYMLTQPADYDQALETFSRPLMRAVQYDLDEMRQSLTILNPSEIEPLYRYPDLTVQTEFLVRAVMHSWEDDLAAELSFLRRYDEYKKMARDVVDLPDRQLDLLVRLLRQNKGALSAAKRRAHFSALTDDEVGQLEFHFAHVFEIPGAAA